MKSLLIKEDGFAFAATAITVSVILAFSALYLSNSVSLNITEASDVYSTSQSYWSTLSGLDYAIQKANDDEALTGIAGTYSFYNSSVTIELSSTDRFGASLGADQTRVISTGTHSQTKRIAELTGQEYFPVNSGKGFWPNMSVIESASDDTLRLYGSFILNDSIYVGENVLNDGATIGDTQFGDPTHIYARIGNSVTGYDPWSVHPDDSLKLPILNFTLEDSLIDLADTITTTSGNKNFGDLVVNEDTLDLSNYTDNTLFVNGVVQLKGATVVGGTYNNPGLLVAAADIVCEASGSTETTVADNILFISKTQVKILNQGQFGNSVTQTVNEIYARIDILIAKDATCYVQNYSRGTLNQVGTVYGMNYSDGALKWTQATAYLEGAVFCGWIEGGELSEGRWNLTHNFPEWFLDPNRVAQYRFKPFAGSLREI